MIRRFAVLLALPVIGCATRPAPSPSVDVLIPQAVACAADPGPAPDYPDSDQALAAAKDIFSGVKLLKAGRILRIAREAELNAALRACVAK